ncbi:MULTISPECIES: S9 family peptidase [Thalassobacillus]|uniref:S9 family peptidase n=1 Tax=Thalassobacillus TaxID=331971 RepID=UPI000A1CB81A|nr:S9 family peptidase [Thalassobacillus devorans]
MSDANRAVTKEDIFNIQSITDPKWSPDGKGIIFVKTHMEKDKDKYISNLFYYDNTSEQVNQWTYGEQKDIQPQWSPKGDYLAFLSTRNKASQLFVLPLAGGEAKQITTCPNGVSDFEWSPDGNRIAFQGALKPDESFDKKTDEEENTNETKPEVKVINRMKYKGDGAGILSEEYEQIGIIDLKREEIETITKPGHDYGLLAWSPEGKCLMYTADEAENKDFSFDSDLVLYDLESKTSTIIETDKGFVSDGAWSPDGRKFAFVFHGQVYKNASHPDILVFDKESEETLNATKDLDFPVGDYMSGDIIQGARMPGVQWVNEETFYFPVSEYGNVVLYEGNDSGNIKQILDGQQHIYGFDVSSGKVAATVATSTEPGELYVFDVSQKEKQKLTDYHDAWLSHVEISEPEEFVYRSVDSWDVHGWIMKPIEFDETERYPLIYQVHGGPHAMYGNTFFHEMQWLASQGYMVAYINPRGSHSYHQEFVDAVRGDYGGNDYVDVMNGLDHLLEKYEFIDEQRLGLTGGSYGGFMTNWIVGHTDRFKAAVTQRSISNWISFYGVSDIGYYFSEWQIKADLRNIKKLWEHSPLAYVDEIETPLLIIHSEQDLRCPIEQAEQLFIALKRQEKDTEFVRIPEADHNLSRTGKPSLRLERLQHLLRWFEEKL